MVALGKTWATPVQPSGPFGPGGAEQIVPGTVAPPFSTIQGRAPGSFQRAGGGVNALSTPGAGTPVPTAGGNANGLSLTGPSAESAQYLGHRGADIADYEKNLDDRVAGGAALRKNAGEIVDAAKQVTLGGGAEIRMKLGSALQALGVNNDAVDAWAGGSQPALSKAGKLTLQNSVSQMKQQIATGKFNEKEFTEYLNNNPSITTDPRATLQIFNLWNQYYDKDKTEQAAFNSYKTGKTTGDKSLDAMIRANGNREPGNWPSLWSHSDYMSNFAPGGAISPEGVRTNSGPLDASGKVAGSGKVTHKYIPGKGIVPVQDSGQ